MSNQAKAAYYNDNDSIVIMEDSLLSNQKRISTNILSISYHSVTAILNLALRLQKDEISVASSITIKSLLSRQSKTNSRIDKMNTTLS